MAKVMVVDDAAFMRMMIKQILTESVTRLLQRLLMGWKLFKSIKKTCRISSRWISRCQSWMV